MCEAVNSLQPPSQFDMSHVPTVFDQVHSFLCPSLQVYDECPTAGSTDCFVNTTHSVGCLVASVAGRVGSSYAVRLEGPQSVSGTVTHVGDGLFTAEYSGPMGGTYELQVNHGYFSGC